MKLFSKVVFILLSIVFLAVVILFILFRLNNKEHTMLTDADRRQAGGQYVQLSQGVTHYELGGPDSGQVIMLIHGMSVPYYIWNGTYEYLLGQGYRVLRYDQFGRGFSDRPDVEYNKALYMKQMAELISTLHLSTPIDIAGISFGGALATDFTAAYPGLVNKVVLIDPAYQIKRPPVPQFFANVMEGINSDKRVNGQLDDFKYPERHPDWVKRYLVQMQFNGFRNALISTVYNYPYDGKESSRLLNTKNKPVLLVWGKEDRTVPFSSSDSIRSVLKAEFLPVENAGHLPYLDQPKQVNEKIAAFLKHAS